MKNKYRMKIAYDGTHYVGWQIQPGQRSIQEEIERVLSIILRQKTKVIGAGRTDTGVHAKGQMAHFTTSSDVDVNKAILSLNGLLPNDIRIKSLDLAHEDFHARFSAKEKTYHYHLWLDPVIDPIFYRYRLHMRNRIDLPLLEAGARKFIGQRDFSSFSNAPNEGSCAKNPIRELKALNVIHQEGGLRLEFVGQSFLYKMVRNIMGTLLEVGQKRRTISSIEDLFKAKDRKAVGAPAPAHGLFLHSIEYE